MLLPKYRLCKSEKRPECRSADASTEVDAASTVKAGKPVSRKCLSIGLQITDRSYSNVFVVEDIDIYYLAPDYHQPTPEGCVKMRFIFANGGNSKFI